MAVPDGLWEQAELLLSPWRPRVRYPSRRLDDRAALAGVAFVLGVADTAANVQAFSWPEAAPG